MKLEDNYIKQVRKLHWLEHFHIIQLDNRAEHNLSDAQKTRLEGILTAERRRLRSSSTRLVHLAQGRPPVATRLGRLE